MFSYIFMKILESRPWRYDRGINVLSGGQAKKIKNEIVVNWIRPGIKILDVGCGTGELFHSYPEEKGWDIPENELQGEDK